ncbi:alpha/beta hydrolase family esterase [Mycobacterium sp. MMS18-G62]
MERRGSKPKAPGATLDRKPVVHPSRRIEGVTASAYEISVLGTNRRYRVIKPCGTEPATVPAIIDLHGSGLSPEEHVAVTDARSFAALGAFIVVPQAGIPFRLLAEWPEGWAWNVPDSPLPGESVARDEPNDIAFIEALTTRLIEDHGVDPRRIHLRGFSGGARLSSHLAVAMADRLASVCCVSGVRFVPSSGGLPALLAIHGGLDFLNPYEGGSGPRWSESVESAVHHWAIAAGCAPTPQCRVISDEVRETRYVDTTGFAAVRLITIADAAHSWPGTSTSDHIAQFGAPGQFSASEAHWNFVHEVDHRQHSLSAGES